MVRTNQGGSILSFLIVGGVMVLLLVGGAYAVRHFFAPSEGSSEIASRQDEDKSKTDSSGSGSDGSSGNKEPSQQEENTPKKEPNNDTPRPPRESQAPRDPADNQPKSPGDLPTTGPEDIVFEGILISSLVALAIAYRQSRQAALSL